jgi:hypothetical protein
MKKFILAVLAALSLATVLSGCYYHPYPYYYRDDYYGRGYRYDRGHYGDRDHDDRFDGRRDYR